MAIQSFTLDPNASALEDQNIPVRNETGGPLAEGDLVYVSGWNAGTSEFLIDLSDAPSNGAHLAQFIMRSTLATATSGFAYKSHTLSGEDTSLAAVGDPVYLSDSTPGGYTLTEPNFAKQVVGRVSVVNVSGDIEFLILSDSDTGFIRSTPGSGEFPVSGMSRDADGNLEVSYDDVVIP